MKYVVRLNEICTAFHWQDSYPFNGVNQLRSVVLNMQAKMTRIEADYKEQRNIIEQQNNRIRFLEALVPERFDKLADDIASVKALQNNPDKSECIS